MSNTVGGRAMVWDAALSRTTTQKKVANPMTPEEKRIRSLTRRVAYLTKRLRAYPSLVAVLQECNAELHGTKLGAAVSDTLRHAGEAQ